MLSLLQGIISHTCYRKQKIGEEKKKVCTDTALLSLVWEHLLSHSFNLVILQ